LFLLAIQVEAQPIRARIRLGSPNPPLLRVELEVPPTNGLSFRNSYGSALGLADRIQSVDALDASDQTVELRQTSPGQYRSDAIITRFNYVVRLEEPKRPAQLAQVSWLNNDYGLLLLADLLPMLGPPGSAVDVKFELPPGWTIEANLESSNGKYLVSDPDKAAFLVGKSLNRKTRRISSTNFSFMTIGKWPFSNNEAIDIVEKLLREHTSVTGYQLNRAVHVMLIPFPGNVDAIHWSAETRGNNVVLLLGNNGGRKQVLSRLGVVLSHELFHLWVPNALAVTGDYDWFFEGFTLYRALRADLRLGLISFNEFLDTLGRAYTSYIRAHDRDLFSLLDASERRWTTSSPVVYDKGLLTAFIYDLMIRRRSDCRETSDDVYAKLFRPHLTGQANGNETIIRLLSDSAEGQFIVEQYVKDNQPINLESVIAQHGLQLNGRQQMTVASKLNAEQRKFLKCLRSPN
jgi:hypothetical protein